MKAKLLPLGVFLLLLACTSVVMACGSRRAPETITVDEANELLARAEALAKAQDLDALCGMGGSVLLCERFWRNSLEWAGVPEEPPEITESYILPNRPLPGGQSTGGRVLVLEGVDGQGRPYQTDFLVFDAGSYGLVPYNPVYWSGMNIAQVE